MTESKGQDLEETVSQCPSEIQGSVQEFKGQNVISKQVDEAAKYAHVISGGFTKKEAFWLRWKLDLRLVPILWLNITLSAMDKVTPSTGALYNMRQDLKLTGNEYSWIGSSFYFGYLLWCLPSASILQKLPVAKTIGIAFIVWGIIILGSSFTTNFAGMCALRVLLGLLEAPIAPGNMLIMTMWYTRPEQALRNGLYYTGLSVILTAPIGYGIGFISGKWFNPWRAFFWITAAISIVWGVIVLLFLPDSPVKAKFLNEREKAIAIDRVRENQTGVENKVFKREQAIEAFTDPKTWVMFWFQIFISIPNGGLTNFSPLIISGLGYSSQRSALLMMPTGIIQTASSYICNFSCFFIEKYKPTAKVRGTIIILGLIPALISAVFLYTLSIHNYLGRLGALYVAYFYLGPYIVSLTLVQANVSGHTKKVTVNAIVFVAYAVSNIIGPQFFKSSQSPLYPLGMGAIFGSYALSILSIAIYMFLCWRDNHQRDKVDVLANQKIHEDTDFQDLTDRQNIHFRYIW